MIDELLKAGGDKLLVPILVSVVGSVLVKGVFGIHCSKSVDRKDFLDLWARHQSQGDLWLEVAVRHLFGTYLPASMIRSLMQGPQAGRALIEISECWSHLDMHDETGEVQWKARRHRSAKKRRLEGKIFGVAYFLLMMIAVLIACATFMEQAGAVASAIAWLYAILIGIVALWCLSRAESLKTASKAVPRWLGLP